MRLLCLLIIAVLLFAWVPSRNMIVVADDIYSRYGFYILTVCGTSDPSDKAVMYYADYAYQTFLYLQELYPSAIWEVRYYTANGSVDGFASRTNVLDWVGDHSGLDCGIYDTMVIFLVGHGGGAYADGTIESGRIDESGDEGLEYPTKGYGVDECLALLDGAEILWDDDLRDALAYSFCRVSVSVISCSNGTDPHCFSGGWIDDLSGMRRVIVTVSNETNIGNYNDYNHQWGFAYHFINALKFPYNLTAAFNYAFLMDEARRENSGGLLGCWETPWFDDDGDRTPTFENGQDILDDDQGLLGSSIAISLSSEGPPIRGLLFGDVNGDNIVTIKDATLIGLHWMEDDPRYDITRDGIIKIEDATWVAINWLKTLEDIL